MFFKEARYSFSSARSSVRLSLQQTKASKKLKNSAVGKAICIPKRPSADESIGRVVSSKETAIVEFQAPWCVYCRRIGSAYSKIADEYNGKLLVAAADIDNDPQLALDYSIELVPTFIVFKDGKPAARIVNPDSKAKLAAFIDENL